MLKLQGCYDQNRITKVQSWVDISKKCVTSSSAIAERPRDAQVTSIHKIAKWNF